MDQVKRYGQFCALARALDQVGDRWTLLVVRELATSTASWTELHGRLPGVASNLLTERLRRLQEHGLVERDGRRYALTPRGAALRPVLHELIRWGAPLMTTGPGDDVVDERWAVLALDALLTGPGGAGPPTTAVLRCGTTALQVHVDDSGRTVTGGVPDDAAADTVVSGTLPDLLGAASAGELLPGLRVQGDEAAARRVLAHAPSA